MKKFLKLIFAVLCFSFLLFSCKDLTLNPKGENYVNVPRPSIDTSNIVINLDNLSNTDTTFITGYVSLKHSLKVDNKPVLSLNIYLDSTLITNEYGSGPLLKSSNFSDGPHTLKVVIVTTSGNGSLADRFGREGFVITKTYPVYIENALPSAPEITSAQPENGKLKLTWQKCSKRTFEYYQIFTGSGSDTIRDINHNYYFDSDFIGGTMEFHVNVTTAAGSVDGNVLSYTDSIPQINKLTLLNNYQIKVEWDSCKYFSNLKSYYILRTTGNNPNSPVQIATINDPKVHSLTDGPLYFGTRITYTVVTNPVKGYAAAVSRRGSTYFGEKWPYSDADIKYLKSTNSFYLRNNAIVYRIDGNNMNVAASSSQSVDYFDLAADGSDGYAVNIFGNNNNPTEIWEIDPQTLQKGKSYSTVNFVGYKSSPMLLFYLPLDRIVYESYIERQTNQYYSDKLVLINISNGDTATLGDSQNNFPFLLQHSTDGKYIALHKGGYLDIYDVSQDKFTLTYSSNGSSGMPTPSNFCFDQNGDDFITTENGTIHIRNCSGGSIIKQYSVGENLISPVVDQVTGYLGVVVSQKNLYRIYDLQDGTVKKEIPVSGGVLTLQNSILFAGGYYLRIQY